MNDYYDVTSERLAQLKERTEAMIAGQYTENLKAQGTQHGIISGAIGASACAHLTIGYVRQHLGAGKERGWWQCTECERKFVPVGPGPA